MKETVQTAIKEAMKAGAKEDLQTLRLVLSALKDREIAERSTENPEGKLPLAQMMAVLENMIKQRHQSIEMYEQGARQELADKERAEIEVIQRFLPKKLSVEEAEAAIRSSIQKTGAAAMKDMGRVIQALKDDFPGQLDMAHISDAVKKALS